MIRHRAARDGGSGPIRSEGTQDPDDNMGGGREPTSSQGLLLRKIPLVLVLVSSCAVAHIYGWKLGLVLILGTLPPIIFSGYLRINLRSKHDCVSASDLASIKEPEEPRYLDSVWYNLIWMIKNRMGQAQSIPTKVDTGSGYSMIPRRLVEDLELEIRPLLNKKQLGGEFGGTQIATEYVTVSISCPTIGQELVHVPVYVMRLMEYQGLLIGTRSIAKFNILGKIQAAKKKHGDLPPGMAPASPSAANWNMVATIHDRRSKGMCCRIFFCCIDCPANGYNRTKTEGRGTLREWSRCSPPGTRRSFCFQSLRGSSVRVRKFDVDRQQCLRLYRLNRPDFNVF